MSQIRVQTNKLCQTFMLGSLLAADVAKRRFEAASEGKKVEQRNTVQMVGSHWGRKISSWTKRWENSE